MIGSKAFEKLMLKYPENLTVHNFFFPFSPDVHAEVFLFSFMFYFFFHL